MAALLDEGGEDLLGDLGEARREGVGESLAPLLKGGADGLEEGLLVLGDVGLLLVETDADHGGVHLGGGDKVSCRDLEELFGLAVILQHGGDGTVLLASCLGAKTVGHLGLDHNGDVLKGQARLQESHEDGGGDVVGQIGADRDLPRVEGGLQKLAEIHLHDVGVDHLHHALGAVLQGVAQDGDEAVVDLHGDDLAVAEGQLLGQDTDTGANLQNGGVGGIRAGIGDVLHHRDVGEEVLSEFLAEMDIVNGHDVLDGADVGKIHKNTFRFV